MMEINKSFKQIQNRRMPLHMVAESWNGGYDLRDTELCVFYFGDGQFVLRPMTVRTGNLKEECTAIHMGDRFYLVLEDIETINDFLFGEDDA